MTITFEAKPPVSTKEVSLDPNPLPKNIFTTSNPERKATPPPLKERRTRSFSTPGHNPENKLEGKSVEEKRKAWANSRINK